MGPSGQNCFAQTHCVRKNVFRFADLIRIPNDLQGFFFFLWVNIAILMIKSMDSCTGSLCFKQTEKQQSTVKYCRFSKAPWCSTCFLSLLEQPYGDFCMQLNCRWRSLGLILILPCAQNRRLMLLTRAQMCTSEIKSCETVLCTTWVLFLFFNHSGYCRVLRRSVPPCPLVSLTKS